jgi:hypothetical protein
VVTVDTVQPELQQAIDLARVLCIPPEAQEAEPLEEGYQPPTPVGFGKVDGIDT